LYLRSLTVAQTQTCQHSRKAYDQLKQIHSKKDNRVQSYKRHGPFDEHTDLLEPHDFERPRHFQETQSVLKGGETKTFCVFFYYNPYNSMQRITLTTKLLLPASNKKGSDPCLQSAMHVSCQTEETDKLENFINRTASYKAKVFTTVGKLFIKWLNSATKKAHCNKKASHSYLQNRKKES